MNHYIVLKTNYATHRIKIYPGYNQPQATKWVPAYFEGNLLTHWRKTCTPSCVVVRGVFLGGGVGEEDGRFAILPAAHL